MSSLICLMSVLAIYLLTLAPTVQGFDSAELTVGAYSLGFVHAPGYPLYMLLGHGFSQLPIGDVGFRLNLMSAVFASLAALVLLWILQKDTQRSYFPLPFAILFATIPVFWSQAVRSEVYTLHVFLMVGVLFLWQRSHLARKKWWYLACFGLLGLAMGNHTTSALLWAAILAVLPWATRDFRRWAAIGTLIGIAIAGILYLYFPLRTVSSPAIDYIGNYFTADLGSVPGLLWLGSARMFHHAVGPGRNLIAIASEVLRFSVLLWDSFLGVGFMLGIWGWWSLRNRKVLWNRLLTLYFLLNLAAFVAYNVVDKDVMFIPIFVVWTIWAANGALELVNWLDWQIPRLSRQSLTAAVALTMVLIVGVGAVLNWNTVSLHQNRKVYEYAAQLLDEVDPSTRVVNHWATASVLDYLQLVEGRRPDVDSFNIDFYNLALTDRYGSLDSPEADAAWKEWLEVELSNRPTCFIEPLPPVPLHFGWEKEGLCWQLTERTYFPVCR